MLTARVPVVFAYNGGIGDRLCNLPALRALASLFPARLVLVCGSLYLVGEVRPMLAGAPR